MNTRYRPHRGDCRGGAQRVTVGAWLCAAIVALGSSFLQAEPAAAQDPPASTALADALERRGTISLRDATLVSWLFTIQKVWNVDVVGGQELENEVVSGSFSDTTLREVLTSILYVRGYGYRKVGNSLVITPLRDMAIKPDQETALIPLHLLVAEEIKPSVQLLLSPDGKVEAVPSSKSLFVIDSPEVVARVRQFLSEAEANAQEGLERERQRLQQQERGGASPGPHPVGPVLEVEEHVRIFKTQYVSAQSIAEALQTVLVGARVSTFGDLPGSGAAGRSGSEPNRVVVVADPHTIQAAARFIEQADVPRPQVRITAYMYDVNVETMQQLGVNWSHAVKGRINGSGDPLSLYAAESRTFPLGTPAPTPPPATGGGAGAAVGGAAAGVLPTQTGSLVTLDYISRHFDLTVLIRMFEQMDGARLLARPNIVAYDGVQAEFASVQEIPVQQLTQTDGGGNIGTTEFREAGITLRVTPRITNQYTIVLEVTPEFSLLSGFSANGQPIIDRRNATTKLELCNGEAAVIAGLLRRNEIETQTGVPGLRYLKHLGWLFRDHDTTVTESELVVFIRAEIVGPSFPGDPRDVMAYKTVEGLLEGIPPASPAPVVPYCGDPHCPYHNPQLRPLPEGPCACIWRRGPACEVHEMSGTPSEWQDPFAPTEAGYGPWSDGSPPPHTPPLAPPLPPPYPPGPPVAPDAAGRLPPVILDNAARQPQWQPRMTRLPEVQHELPHQASFDR